MPAITYEGRRGKINRYGHLVAHSLMEKYIAHRAKVYKDVFMWTTNIATPGADTNIIWIRNDSKTKLLRLDLVQIYSSATAEVETFFGTGNTAGGTLLTGNNTYLGQPKDDGAVCYAQNTNVDAGAGMTNMANIRVGATNEEELDVVGALTIPYNYEYALNVVTGSLANIKVNLMGFFDPPTEAVV
ncbi:MAG: hypothetical protein ACYTFW_00780 [Planctomycetota bacterium]|jgi:hypothetical protein